MTGTQHDDERAAATEQCPAGHGLLAQAAAIDAADRELEQTIRAWAAADDDLGWAGSPEVAQHAEELAGYLAEQGYGRPPVRSCCASRMGQRHAFGCAALAAAMHGQDEPVTPPAAAPTPAQQDDDPTREDRAVAAGFVRRARAANSDDEVDAARDAIARDIAAERALAAGPSADTETLRPVLLALAERWESQVAPRSFHPAGTRADSHSQALAEAAADLRAALDGER